MEWEFECISQDYLPRQFEYNQQDDNRMIFGTMYGEVCGVDLTTKAITEYGNKGKSTRDAILGLRWMKGDLCDQFMVGSAEGRLTCNDSRSAGAVVREYTAFDKLTSVHLSCDNRHMLVSGYAQHAHVYDVETGQVTRQYTDIHSDYINISRFANLSPSLLCTSSFDSTIKTWDLRVTQQAGPIYTLRANSGLVMVNFSADDTFLLASALDNEINQYLFVDGSLHLTYALPSTGLKGNFTRAYYSATGKYTLTGACEESSVKYLCAYTGECLCTVDMFPGRRERSLYVQTLRGNPRRDDELCVLANYRESGHRELVVARGRERVRGRERDAERVGEMWAPSQCVRKRVDVCEKVGLCEEAVFESSVCDMNVCEGGVCESSMCKTSVCEESVCEPVCGDGVNNNMCESESERETALSESLPLSSSHLSEQLFRLRQRAHAHTLALSSLSQHTQPHHTVDSDVCVLTHRGVHSAALSHLTTLSHNATTRFEREMETLLSLSLCAPRQCVHGFVALARCPSLFALYLSQQRDRREKVCESVCERETQREYERVCESLNEIDTQRDTQKDSQKDSQRENGSETAHYESALNGQTIDLTDLVSLSHWREVSLLLDYLYVGLNAIDPLTLRVYALLRHVSRTPRGEWAREKERLLARVAESVWAADEIERETERHTVREKVVRGFTLSVRAKKKKRESPTHNATTQHTQKQENEEDNERETRTHTERDKETETAVDELYSLCADESLWRVSLSLSLSLCDVLFSLHALALTFSLPLVQQRCCTLLAESLSPHNVLYVSHWAYACCERVLYERCVQCLVQCGHWLCAPREWCEALSLPTQHDHTTRPTLIDLALRCVSESCGDVPLSSLLCERDLALCEAVLSALRTHTPQVVTREELRAHCLSHHTTRSHSAARETVLWENEPRLACERCLWEQEKQGEGEAHDALLQHTQSTEPHTQPTQPTQPLTQSLTQSTEPHTSHTQPSPTQSHTHSHTQPPHTTHTTHTSLSKQHNHTSCLLLDRFVLYAGGVSVDRWLPLSRVLLYDTHTQRFVHALCGGTRVPTLAQFSQAVSLSKKHASRCVLLGGKIRRGERLSCNPSGVYENHDSVCKNVVWDTLRHPQHYTKHAYNAAHSYEDPHSKDITHSPTRAYVKSIARYDEEEDEEELRYTLKNPDRVYIPEFDVLTCTWRCVRVEIDTRLSENERYVREYRHNHLTLSHNEEEDEEDERERGAQSASQRTHTMRARSLVSAYSGRLGGSAVPLYLSDVPYRCACCLFPSLSVSLLGDAQCDCERVNHRRERQRERGTESETQRGTRRESEKNTEKDPHRESGSGSHTESDTKSEIESESDAAVFALQFGGYCSHSQSLTNDVHVLVCERLSLPLRAHTVPRYDLWEHAQHALRDNALSTQPPHTQPLHTQRPSQHPHSQPPLTQPLPTYMHRYVWRKVRTHGSRAPSPRYAHASALLPSDVMRCAARGVGDGLARMLVYGGQSAGETLPELVALCVPHKPTPPMRSLSQSSVSQTLRENPLVANVAELVWESCEVVGETPLCRHKHTLSHIPHTALCVMFGGFPCHTHTPHNASAALSLSDVWTLQWSWHPRTAQLQFVWSRVLSHTALFAPSPRAYHTANVCVTWPSHTNTHTDTHTDTDIHSGSERERGAPAVRLFVFGGVDERISAQSARGTDRVKDSVVHVCELSLAHNDNDNEDIENGGNEDGCDEGVEVVTPHHNDDSIPSLNTSTPSLNTPSHIHSTPSLLDVSCVSAQWHSPASLSQRVVLIDREPRETECACSLGEDMRHVTFASSLDAPIQPHTQDTTPNSVTQPWQREIARMLSERTHTTTANPFLPDLTLRVPPAETDHTTPSYNNNAHTVSGYASLLCERSVLLHTMLHSEMREAHTREISLSPPQGSETSSSSLRGVLALCEFLTSNHVSARSVEDVVRLLSLSQEFQVDALTRKCEGALLRMVNDESVCELLSYASWLDLSLLRCVCYATLLRAENVRELLTRENCEREFSEEEQQEDESDVGGETAEVVCVGEKRRVSLREYRALPVDVKSAFRDFCRENVHVAGFDVKQT